MTAGLSQCGPAAKRSPVRPRLAPAWPAFVGSRTALLRISCCPRADPSGLRGLKKPFSFTYKSWKSTLQKHKMRKPRSLGALKRVELGARRLVTWRFCPSPRVWSWSRLQAPPSVRETITCYPTTRSEPLIRSQCYFFAWAFLNKDGTILYILSSLAFYFLFGNHYGLTGHSKEAQGGPFTQRPPGATAPTTTCWCTAIFTSLTVV